MPQVLGSAISFQVAKAFIPQQPNLPRLVEKLTMLEQYFLLFSQHLTSVLVSDSEYCH